MVHPIQVGLVFIYLIVGTEGTVLVDTGYPGDIEKVSRSITKAGVRLKEIDLILLTHSHLDHAGNAFELRKMTGARIAAQKNAVGALRKGIDTALNPVGVKGRVVGWFLKTLKTDGVRPDIIIEKEMDLEPFGVKGTVIRTPGHTAGSVSVILDNGQAIIGDLLMGGLIFKRSPCLPLFALNVDAIPNSLKKVLSLRPKILHASHGGPFDPVEVARKFNISTPEAK